MKIELRIKLSRLQVESLYSLYNHFYTEYNPEGEHEKLLYEHLLEMHFKLQGLFNKHQGTYTLPLTATEAIAFFQTWNTIEVHDKLADVTTRNIIALIDKKAKAPRHGEAINTDRIGTRRVSA